MSRMNVWRSLMDQRLALKGVVRIGTRPYDRQEKTHMMEQKRYNVNMTSLVASGMTRICGRLARRTMLRKSYNR